MRFWREFPFNTVVVVIWVVVVIEDYIQNFSQRGILKRSHAVER